MIALDGLKVGDEVVIYCHFNSDRLATVARITPSRQFVLSTGERAGKDGSWGDSWHRSHIRPATDKDRAAIALEDDRYLLRVRLEKAAGLTREMNRAEVDALLSALDSATSRNGRGESCTSNVVGRE